MVFVHDPGSCVQPSNNHSPKKKKKSNFCCFPNSNPFWSPSNLASRGEMMELWLWVATGKPSRMFDNCHLCQLVLLNCQKATFVLILIEAWVGGFNLVSPGCCHPSSICIDFCSERWIEREGKKFSKAREKKDKKKKNSVKKGNFS